MMFGGAFNRIVFDGGYIPELTFGADFEVKTEFDSRMNLDMAITAMFEFISEFEATMVREQTYNADFQFMTGLEATMVRERSMVALFEFKTELKAGVRYTHTDEFTFTGEFNPSERIVIDTKKMKITKNGQNVFHLHGGEFLEIAFGENTITYTDSEGSRAVLTRVTHKDKYLY
ncbi:hypothetical protein M2444_005351 [Paenibacillus sp. PastF-3]|uniref:phage distal tail protein n=1 Tax=Paenibacillus sp. PastF-3 TaxID=2940626 RepID=UPI00247311D9|nr:hypothetical protein [Paenibacillus sp. PastF-3]MDH6373519.1 hypothetical protein [Paenibacillus sp. PastF-3]